MGPEHVPALRGEASEAAALERQTSLIVYRPFRVSTEESLILGESIRRADLNMVQRVMLKIIMRELSVPAVILGDGNYSSYR